MQLEKDHDFQRMEGQQQLHLTHFLRGAGQNGSTMTAVQKKLGQ